VFDLVDVSGGVFSMGSTTEEARRCVDFWKDRLADPTYEASQFHQWILKECPTCTVTVEPFQITRFPVTNAEYRCFVAATNGTTPESLRIDEPPDHPVWGVSFEDAEAYTGWAASVSGKRCRLPTEAQWEYAARGPSRLQYPFGDAFDAEACNTMESGIGGTTPVDRYARGSSPFGVLDMAGNVEEWTASLYEPYPGGTFIHDELSRTLGPRYRILRGGSFARGGDLARCARRHGPLRAPQFRFTGFRLAVLTGRPA